MESSEKHTEHAHSPDHNEDVKTLISWQGSARPFKKHGRQFYLSVLLLVFLVWIILFLFGEYLLMITIGALAFLGVVLSTIPPGEYHYRISTEGVKIEDHFYIWSELYDFYFKTVHGADTLIIRTKALIPGELHMPLDHMSRDHLRKIVINFLPYREVVRPTFMEKSADWLTRNFPLEADKK